jgi:F0F1-type ATP synthase membrane subunit c/vacuolar-type H+-ATPase subunit K
MTAYQFRPIRGRRFDGWRLLGTGIVIGAGAFGAGLLVAIAWAVSLLLPAAERYLP